MNSLSCYNNISVIANSVLGIKVIFLGYCQKMQCASCSFSSHEHTRPSPCCHSHLQSGNLIKIKLEESTFSKQGWPIPTVLVGPSSWLRTCMTRFRLANDGCIKQSSKKQSEIGTLILFVINLLCLSTFRKCLYKRD